MLLGLPRAAEAAPPVRAFALVDGGVRVSLGDETGATRRLLDFDAEGRARRLEVREGPNGASYVVHYDDYRVVGAGGPFAHRLTIELADGRARLAFADVVLNPTLPADIFRPDDPAAAGSAQAEGG